MIAGWRWMRETAAIQLVRGLQWPVDTDLPDFFTIRHKNGEKILEFPPFSQVNNLLALIQQADSRIAARAGRGIKPDKNWIISQKIVSIPGFASLPANSVFPG